MQPFLKFIPNLIMSIPFVLRRQLRRDADHARAVKPYFLVDILVKLLLPALLVVSIARAEAPSIGEAYRQELLSKKGVQTLEKRTLLSAEDGLPTAELWMSHVRNDLLPFWTSPAAIGVPEGNFPTFRAYGGSTIDSLNPQDEFLEIPDSEIWLKGRVNRQYSRMMGRQIYAYCVAYQMTGDERALELAKRGTEYLLGNMYDSRGFFYTWRMQRRDGTYERFPEEEYIISQDISYALLGPAMYYYITRDPKVLPVIQQCKEYIFEKYRIEGSRNLRWIRESYRDFEELHTREQLELVAQLDQINAYMLLVTRLLDGEDRKTWETDLVNLAELIKSEYYNEENNVFWGRIDKEAYKQLGKPHVDFGHTIKTFWMIYLIGEQFQRADLSKFSLEHGPSVLKEAFHRPYETWIEKKLPGGQLGTDRVWWVHNELDQAAATFMLVDGSQKNYLQFSYRYWFEQFIDLRSKEAWHSLVGPMPGVPAYLKAHLWKNGFHSFEHALVGYITGEAYRRKPVSLYYAFREIPDHSLIQPYLYRGEIEQAKITTTEFSSAALSGLKKRAVTFVNVRP
ncbi:MAG: N-acylglucosamine 2-epimerase [uncultured bacterium]|nr:MAG: N-acylglucosamine 2-epimerase [uncultured bacterium]HBG18340.1 hypothetical protein [Desulfobulbaceae bacterium]